MTILYELGCNLYVNLTNRCPCRCAFCIRQKSKGVGTGDDLWLEHVTSGGRVLGITAAAPTLKEALRDAYAATETVEFEGKYLRHDIGQRALAAMEGL